MEDAKLRITEILEKSPLPEQMKIYFKGRLEKEGVSDRLIESMKSMLRAAEADAFGRMGIYVDEDDSPDLRKAVKLHSDAIGAAADTYKAAMEAASGKVVEANKKASKTIEKIEKEVLKANVA
jgi:hypothetical protein